MENASNLAMPVHHVKVDQSSRRNRIMQKDKRSRFWDRIAKRYARSPISDEAAYQKKLEVTRQYFRPEMNVLEIGCGTGSTALAHAPFVSHIHATDISERMLDIAREKAKAQNITNVSFEQLAVDALHQPDNSLDAVLGLSILHLLEDKEAAIGSVYRMLKPGGVFITSTACLGDTMKYFKLIGSVGHFLGLLPLVRIFTTQELEQSLIRSGFAIDYQWTPGKGKAVFMVAKKPE